MQQLAWQIQNEHKLHMLDFPKGWWVIAIDNPDDEMYEIENIEDAAGLRRMLHIYTEVSIRDFLTYAKENNFHPLIIEFIQTFPDFLYDFESQKQGSVYANPASYERLSNILWGYELAGSGPTVFLNNLDNIEAESSGLINFSMTRNLIDFIKNQDIISPKDIFLNYTKEIQPKIKKLVKENNTPKLAQLINSFSVFMVSERLDYNDEQLNNIMEFLIDVPVDTAAVFITNIHQLDRTAPDFKYMTSLHIKLSEDKRYRTNFYDKLVNLMSTKK
jgi:hypothetical protein